jgi:hypothetical protein
LAETYAKAVIPSRENEHFIASIMFHNKSACLSALWQIGRKMSEDNQRREGGLVTKVVTTEKLLDDQLAVTH